MSIIIGKNKSITAFYIVETTFENALATIKITLKKYNNDWKIIGFHIDSDYFKSKFSGTNK
jgi:hypothetical protein